MVREVSVCKEAEAEVEADEADAADEAVEVSSEALLAESRLESSTLAMIRPTITTTIRAGPAQLQIFCNALLSLRAPALWHAVPWQLFCFLCS